MGGSARRVCGLDYGCSQLIRATEWNDDVVSYESKRLMDIGVVLEPLVGNRVCHSLENLDETIRLIWGPEGMNVEKMAEGHPSACQLLWGFYMNFDTLQAFLLEPKRMCAKYLLAKPALQRGCRSVQLRFLRELAGCAQYLLIVCPLLCPHLATLYAQGTIGL